MSGKLKVCVVGSGAWGSALACTIKRAGHDVAIWGRDAGAINEICTNQRNPRYLGDIPLMAGITSSTILADAIRGVDVILLVIPAQSIREMVGEFVKCTDKSQTIIVCAKGIDSQTGKTPATIVSDAFGTKSVGVLSGPSFAIDVARGLPTAVTLAFDDLGTAKQYADLLSSENFRIYASDDLIGVELGGALKNVLALAVGSARGMELGASAEAALIARGFSELRRVAKKLGARSETLAGLSGLGDLVLTASSTQSRNFSYGVALGLGNAPDGLALAEGAFTAPIAARIAIENGIDAPIIQAIADVLVNRLTARQAVSQLLARPLKAEF